MNETLMYLTSSVTAIVVVLGYLAARCHAIESRIDELFNGPACGTEDLGENGSIADPNFDAAGAATRTRFTGQPQLSQNL